jgi:hypothetical protein
MGLVLQVYQKSFSTKEHDDDNDELTQIQEGVNDFYFLVIMHQTHMWKATTTNFISMLWTHSLNTQIK